MSCRCQLLPSRFGVHPQFVQSAAAAPKAGLVQGWQPHCHQPRKRLVTASPGPGLARPRFVTGSFSDGIHTAEVFADGRLPDLRDADLA